MSKYSREQHPLLCEEGSEEELYSPRFYRRDHPTSSYRARARTKGLAAILTRWPDHWSSFVTYWWIGVGMISFTTFIIYNSLFAFSMLPAVNMKPASIITADENSSTIISTTLPEVYMHVFTDQNEDIDLSQYLPYIETIASTFMDYKFNFIVVINVTDVSWLSAEENNEMALNMLWTTNKHIYQKTIRSPNVNIEHVSLSLYLDNSLLNKYWRILPQHLIEFLVRTVSIWDKGGVALNPDILSPKFQHSLYVKKLQKLLNKYANTNRVMEDSDLVNKITKAPNKYKKVNNIRDIINALEKENVSGNAFSQQILTEAENRDISFVRRERQAPAKTNINRVNSAITYTDKITSNTNQNTTDSFNQSAHVINENSAKSRHPLEISSNSSNISFLPLFLKFLFKNSVHIKSEPTEKELINRTRKSVIEMSNSEVYTQNNFLEETKKELENDYKPVIVSAAGFFNKSENYNVTDGSHDEFTEQDLEANTLTIDLKGNIIATNVPCHAFLGTMYSNVIHHNQEESLSDFIVAELSIFCKGLLSSCNGIDLILI